MAGRPRPVELRLKTAERVLEVDFSDGQRFQFPAEFLRVESPSAEIQGHGPGRKTILPGRRHVAIARLEPVGNYAVRIHFDDGHSTGLYSWDYLYEIGRNREELWRAYLAGLAAQGLSRDP